MNNVDNNRVKDHADTTNVNRNYVIFIVIAAIALVAFIIAGMVLLLSPNITSEVVVARLRDVFIIFMAFESLLVGLAVVILMVQVSKLINLLNNEVKPIIESTNETISTLRGTTTFLSNNLVEPVMKTNEYLAGLREVLNIFKLTRKK